MTQTTQDPAIATSGPELFALAASIEALHQELSVHGQLEASQLQTYLMHKVRRDLAVALGQPDAQAHWEQKLAEQTEHPAPTATPAASEPKRYLTVTTNPQGQAVAVTWQDDEHRILEVVWRAPAAPKNVDLAAQAARLFMQELLGTHSTLAAIVEKYGQRTVMELHHLQHAILNDSFVPRYEVACYAYDVASALPSGKRWAEYFRDAG